MRKILFAATVAVAGAMPLMSADAAPRPVLGTHGVTNGASVLTVREAKEAPRREDRQADRRQDRRASNTTPGGFDRSGIILVRQAGEGPRGEGKGHP